MSPARFRAASAVALLTVLVAILLRYESARHEMTGLASSCSVLGSERIDCDAVQTSAYAKVMGVSLATWGAAGAGILLLWLLASRREPALLVVAGAAAAAAVAVVLYTAFVSWFKLGKICIYCSVMQAGFIALAILVGPAAWRARASLPRRPLLLGGTTAAILLALALSGEAFAAQRIRLGRMFAPSGKGLRLDISESLLLGDPTTRIAVVLFFDFGCPGCRKCVATATELVRKYPHCVHARFKHYPLDRECNERLAQTVHTAACRAAVAGQAAQALKLDAKALQVIFEHQDDGFGRHVLTQIGKELGVAEDTWSSLLGSPSVHALVERDIAEGNAMDLRQVPVAYVNGRPVDAARLEETVSQLCSR